MSRSIDPVGNGRLGLQVPSTVKKPMSVSKLRQSFAGAQQHMGLGIPRPSLYPGQPMGPPPSVSKPGPSTFGRTPLRNSVRTSQWPGGRQSMLPPTPGPSHTHKDPRNARDKAVQQAMRNVIWTRLQESQFQGVISRQTLLSPTAKDFRGIFEHFLVLIDPAYKAIENGKKFEDEVINILKVLHYPFVDAIDKKWLAAPASMHSWPSLLAMLHWLAQISKASYSYLDSSDPTLQEADQVPEVFDDENHHKALEFEYNSDAYGVFLTGVDDFSEQDQRLESRYARKNENFLADFDALNTEEQALVNEFQILTEKPSPIIELEAESNALTRDQKKFEDFLEHCENRSRKILDSINREQKEIQQDAENLRKLHEDEDRLTITVKEQNLSPEEVVQMNSEQETLSRIVDELRRKTEETRQQARSYEITLAQRFDNVEQSIDEYTALLDNLRLFPVVLPPLPSADLRLEANFASADPRGLIRRVQDGTSADLKNDVKVILNGIAVYKRQELQALEDQVVTVADDLDTVTAETDKLEEDMLNTERRTNDLQDESEAIKTAANQAATASNGTITRLQKDLAHARAVAHARGVNATSHLQELEIAYQEQVERVKKLREETVRTILKSSSDIGAFKEEVSNHLNTLRQFAEEN